MHYYGGRTLPVPASVRIAPDCIDVDGPRREQLPDAIDVAVELLRAVRRVGDCQPAEVETDDATQDRADDEQLGREDARLVEQRVFETTRGTAPIQLV